MDHQSQAELLENVKDSSMADTKQPKYQKLFWKLGNSPQPFSPMSVAKHSRLRGATAVNSVCPYCAVGCAQRCTSRTAQIIDIEGDPRSPINEGTLCPKGANTFQLDHQSAPAEAGAVPRAVQRPLGGEAARLGDGPHRAAHQRDARRDFRRARRRRRHHSTTPLAMAHLGGATLDNEENYLIKKLFNNLGIVAIENQARI